MKRSTICYLFASIACNPVIIGPEPIEPTTVEDGRTEIQVACDVYRALKCEEGDDTPNGATCEEVADNAARIGIDLVVDPDCMKRAETCEQARACNE